MKHAQYSVLVLAVLISFVCGCATMFGDSNDELRFDSEPQGATVLIDGKDAGTTPCKVSLPRKFDNSDVIFKKAGYSTKTMSLTRTISPPAYFNLGFITTTSGATSWGIDAASGHLLSYSPRAYVVKLEPTGHEARGNAASALEFAIANYDRLQIEIASGKGEIFTGLCALYSMDTYQCSRFFKATAEHKADLLTRADGLALYRAINGIADSRGARSVD